MSEKETTNEEIVDFLNPIFKSHGYIKDGRKRWRLKKDGFMLGVCVQSSQYGKQYYLNLELSLTNSIFENIMVARLHPKQEVNWGGAFNLDKPKQEVFPILQTQLEQEVFPLFESIKDINELKRYFSGYPMAMALLNNLPKI